MKHRKLNMIYAIILVLTLFALFKLTACGTESTVQDSNAPEDSSIQDDSGTAGDSSVQEESGTAGDSSVQDDSSDSSPVGSYDESNIDPEFKELVDSYEAHMDIYFEFMKTYDENDKSQEDEFWEVLDGYTTIDKALKEWEKKGLNADEQAYYEEALDRVGEKQLEADIAKG